MKLGIFQKLYVFVKVRLLHVDLRSSFEIAVSNGLKSGENTAVLGEVILDPGHCWLIELGDNVTLAPRVHILAHDASTKRALDYTRIARVVIGNNVFVGAGSIILPGVTIGDNCIIGAGSIVTKDIPSGWVAAGNPCIPIKRYNDYISESKEKLTNKPVYDSSYSINSITADMKKRMINDLKCNGEGFIK